jgi:aarF domain-containing kinase
LFAPTTCAALSTLHHKVAQEPWALTAETVQRGLTAQDSVELVSIQTDPIGAGCIAQVHEAKVRLLRHPSYTNCDSLDPDCEAHREHTTFVARLSQYMNDMLTFFGNDTSISDKSVTRSKTSPEVVSVAIKVRRTGVCSQVEQDLRLLSRAAEIMQVLLNSRRWFVIVDAVQMFSSLMRSQLNLEHEALNIEHFKRNFADVQENWQDRRGGEGGVRFADCFLATPSMLVQSLEEGELLTVGLHPDSALLRDEKARKRLADICVKAFLKMVIVDSFCHSDLHPGNILGKYSYIVCMYVCMYVGRAVLHSLYSSHVTTN